MSAAKDVAAAISRLVDARSKGAPTVVSDALPEQDDAVAVLVQSFLLWQSTTDKAASAYEKVRRTFVDWNDLRVSMPDEVVEIIGPRYPEVEERCQRLRAVLRHLYQREHEMSFTSAEAAGKRSMRKYLESLEGMLPYVADRTLLVAFGGHGVPVDENLRLHLVEAGIVDQSADDAEASSVMQRHVKASDALAVHLALQAWIDEVGPAKSASGRSGRRTSSGGRSTAESGTSSRKKTPVKKSSKKKTGGSSKTAASSSASTSAKGGGTKASGAAKASTGKKTVSRKTGRKSAARSSSS